MTKNSLDLQNTSLWSLLSSLRKNWWPSSSENGVIYIRLESLFSSAHRLSVCDTFCNLHVSQNSLTKQCHRKLYLPIINTCRNVKLSQGILDHVVQIVVSKVCFAYMCLPPCWSPSIYKIQIMQGILKIKSINQRKFMWKINQDYNT